MLVKTYSAAVNGLDVTPVTIEVSLTRGVMYHFTGLGDVAVREGRDRPCDAGGGNDRGGWAPDGRGARLP